MASINACQSQKVAAFAFGDDQHVSPIRDANGRKATPAAASVGGFIAGTDPQGAFTTDSSVMQPTPPVNSNPRWWCVSLMNGARIERLGIVRACDYEGAIAKAMEKFRLAEQQQRRLIVWQEESGHL
jgi:hypothetical protein